MRRLLLVAALVAACSGSRIGAQPSAGLSDPPGPVATQAPNADTPPPGQTWFGSSFDTDTYEVVGRTMTVSRSKEFAVVARFTKIVRQSFRVQILHGDVVEFESNVTTDEADVYAKVALPSENFFEATGTYTVRARDAGGNVISEGSVTVTP